MTSVRPPERRQLTVMFCDMVASTALSLRLDPEELAEVIQAYRQRCAEVITRHDGIVARQIGDAVLAYFGYPHAHEDDAERAIRTALAIAKAQRPQAGSEDMRVHIGIATGVVVVGNLPQGGEELSAIGSALNLAARLEGLAGPGMVVVSDQTQRLARRPVRLPRPGPTGPEGFRRARTGLGGSRRTQRRQPVSCPASLCPDSARGSPARIGRASTALGRRMRRAGRGAVADRLRRASENRGLPMSSRIASSTGAAFGSGTTALPTCRAAHWRR